MKMVHSGEFQNTCICTCVYKLDLRVATRSSHLSDFGLSSRVNSQHFQTVAEYYVNRCAAVNFESRRKKSNFSSLSG